MLRNCKLSKDLVQVGHWSPHALADWHSEWLYVDGKHSVLSVQVYRVEVITFHSYSSDPTLMPTPFRSLKPHMWEFALSAVPVELSLTDVTGLTGTTHHHDFKC